MEDNMNKLEMLKGANYWCRVKLDDAMFKPGSVEAAQSQLEWDKWCASYPLAYRTKARILGDVIYNTLEFAYV